MGASDGEEAPTKATPGTLERQPERVATPNPQDDLAKPPSTPPRRSLTEIVKDNIVVVIAISVFATVLALVSAWNAVVSHIDSKVASEVNQKMLELRVSISDAINKRAEPTLLYGFNEQGQRIGDLANLISAARGGRTIFVRYTRKDATYQARWFRICDNMSFDYYGGKEILTCFMLRVPDTNPADSGRTFSDTLNFEDRSVSSGGLMRWRKYSIVNGRLNSDPTAYEAQTTDIQWWSAPSPTVTGP